MVKTKEPEAEIKPEYTLDTESQTVKEEAQVHVPRERLYFSGQLGFFLIIFLTAAIFLVRVF